MVLNAERCTFADRRHLTDWGQRFIGESEPTIKPHQAIIVFARPDVAMSGANPSSAAPVMDIGAITALFHSLLESLRLPSMSWCIGGRSAFGPQECSNYFPIRKARPNGRAP
jgi:hypothetical protein